MTTTPAVVLAQLQSHWRTVQHPAEADAEPATIPYCGAHNDPETWEYTPDHYGRPGFRTVHCKSCGRFIGYRPPQEDKKRKPRKERSHDNRKVGS